MKIIGFQNTLIDFVSTYTENLFTYCVSHKHFVPDKKMICKVKTTY